MLYWFQEHWINTSVIAVGGCMISIVIAAYNEEKRIGRSLRAIREYLISRNIPSEIIVVDDGSRDRTTDIVNGMAGEFPNLRVIRYEKNRGKGFALRTGVLATRGDLVLVSDADLSTPIEDLASLQRLIVSNECQVAIGSRALALSNIIQKQPWWRQGMGKIFNRVVRFVIMDDFCDTQCGFKLFTGQAARRLFGEARIDRFAYDVEILALAKKLGYGIVEVPIRWVNAPGSKVNPLVDSLRMLLDLVRIRMYVGSVRHCHINADLRAEAVHH